MSDNYLNIVHKYFEDEYPNKEIEVNYLELVDDVIYSTHTSYDILIFVGLSDDSCTEENMYKAMMFATENNITTIFALIERDIDRCTCVDYSVKYIYSTPCMHIALSFEKLLQKLSSNTNLRTKIEEIQKYFKLPSACYISSHLIKNIPDLISVNVYTEHHGSLSQRLIE